MIRRPSIRAAALLSLAIAVWPPISSFAGGRMRAQVTCQPAQEPLVYHCTIKLTERETGQPIEGAEFRMYTSMPDMPMAHIMPPVQGKPGSEPGTYHGTFRFEMAGEWVIDIRTTAPSRDQMLQKIMVRKPRAASEEETHETPMD